MLSRFWVCDYVLDSGKFLDSEGKKAIHLNILSKVKTYSCGDDYLWFPIHIMMQCMKGTIYYVQVAYYQSAPVWGNHVSVHMYILCLIKLPLKE